MDVSTAQESQHLWAPTLAEEHLMICLCGVDVEQDVDAKVLEDSLKKIIRIKLQMGGHRISLARAHGSQIDVAQEFTKNADELVGAVPCLLCLDDHEDAVDLDAVLACAARHFSARRDMEHQATSSFRLLMVYRHINQSPRLQASQSEVSRAFINDLTYHLDAIYWHQDVPMEAAQVVFDQLCAYDSSNPFAKFYFLEVGESLERLHQALVLVLSHPAHRLGQIAAEDLLGSWLSQAKELILDQKQGCTGQVK